MTEPVNRDEHMYLGAASLLADHRMYADFAFLQPPYSAWIYRALDLVVPGDWVLLPARLLKSIVTGGMILMLFVLLRRLGARSLLAAALAILLFQDSLVRDMAALTRNYDFAQMAILGALLLLPLHREDPAGPVRLLAAGTLATAATGFKITYAPLSILVLLWPLFTGLRGGSRALVWLAAGALLGVAPLLLSLVGVDFETVRFNLLDYHYLNAEFHTMEGYRPQATILDRAGQGWGLLLGEDHWPLTGIALLSLGLAFGPWRRLRSPDPAARTALAVLLTWLFVATSIMMAVLPRPLQTSYFAPVLYGLTLVIGAHAGRLNRGGGRLLLVVSGLIIMIGILTHAGDARDLGAAALRTSEWTGVQVHRGGRALALATGGTARRPVATTHPIYVLEAGLPVYPEFGAAEFAWRSGSLLSPRQRERFGVVSAETLEDLLRERPPAAILTEPDAPWDGPLAEWARQRNWRQTAPLDSMLLIWTP